MHDKFLIYALLHHDNFALHLLINLLKSKLIFLFKSRLNYYVQINTMSLYWLNYNIIFKYKYFFAFMIFSRSTLRFLKQHKQDIWDYMYIPFIIKESDSY